MKQVPAHKRDSTIDVVRGIAIVTMVGANLALLLPEPHGLLIRVYSSFAAPIFVCLAGTMMALVVRADKTSKHPFSYFVKRGLFLLTMGAFIDVAGWRLFPFIGFDVLYLLGFTLPLLFLAAHLSAERVALCALWVFTLTPLLQAVFGYADVPHMPEIKDANSLFALEISAVVKHWFVDGWFPLFPWFGYGLIGIVIGKCRWQTENEVQLFSNKVAAILAIAMLAFGALIMFLAPGPLHNRAGFSELFYPATVGFISLSLGVVIALIALVDWLSSKHWSVFRVFGEASLFMYVVHSMIISAALFPFYPQVSFTNYLLIYFALIVLLGVCGLVLRRVRSRFRGMPLLMKWVVGG